MPTANLQPCEGAELPKEGVYATRIEVRGQTYNSVTNVGRRPSVDADEDVTVEAYILDFEDDIYGEEVQIEFVDYLRPVQKFENLEAVQKQVQLDIKIVRDIF